MSAQLFRGNLPSVAKIWDETNGRDLYTGWSVDEFSSLTFKGLSAVVSNYEHYKEKRATQVERDHIVECQIIGHIWDNHMPEGHRPARKREAVRQISQVVNSTRNLNNTCGALNMKKEDGVEAFLRDYESKGSGLRDHLKRYGVQPNAVRRICTVFDKAATIIQDSVKGFGDQVYDDFADELITLVGHCHI